VLFFKLGVGLDKSGSDGFGLLAVEHMRVKIAFEWSVTKRKGLD